MSTRTIIKGIVVVVCTFVHLMGEEIIVKTNAGYIKGVVHHVDARYPSRVVSGFYSVPYAESPVGDLRFTKPVRRKPFSSVFDATKLTVRCAMSPDYSAVSPLPYSEDCLHLSIIVPGRISDSASNHSLPLPVMIYIYGGSWQSGSQDTYISFRLAEESGVILVTINYRLSFFGFLANTDADTDLKGNYGLWDQHMAIQWVHDNIAAFGGDAARVTLFGNSAGAASVIYQSLFIGNKGLIHNVMAQSGSPLAHWGIVKTPEASYVEFAKKVNCYTGSSLTCIRSKTLYELMSISNFYADFLPVVDGEFIPEDPFLLFQNKSKEANEALKMFGSLNLVIGTNSNDGAGVLVDVYTNEFLTFEYGISYNKLQTEFRGSLCTNDDMLINRVLEEYGGDRTKNGTELAKVYFEFLMDLAFVHSVVETAKAHARINGSGSTFYYVFDHKPSYSSMPGWYKGASHGDDRGFIFAFASRLMKQVYNTDAINNEPDVNPEERELSQLMMSYWTNFAKHGDPNYNSLQQWPPYDVTNQTYLVFRTQLPLPIRAYYRLSKMELWQQLNPNTMLNGFRCSSGVRAEVPRLLWLIPPVLAILYMQYTYP